MDRIKAQLFTSQVGYLVLVMVTLIPRLALAHSLDLITDEGVYIPNGRKDVLLLLHGALLNHHWLDNLEAPAYPKIWMGFGSFIGQWLWGNAGILWGARLAGIALCAASIVVMVHLARPIVGTAGAYLGGIFLALSPWLTYFSSLAYLDMYMVNFAAIAILLTWHAVRKPPLFLLVGALLGFAMASKYTAIAAVVPIVGYICYRHFRYGATFQRGMLLATCGVFGGVFFLADPALWGNPPVRFVQSFGFQFVHAHIGHTVFWFGQTWEHVPLGLGLLMVVAKISLFIIIPAGGFLALYSARAALRRWPADQHAFLFCWVVGLSAPLSLLTIIVGTHYLLPLAPAIAFTAARGLVLAVRQSAIFVHNQSEQRRWGTVSVKKTAAIGLLIVALVAILPSAAALVTVNQGEGYTSEWLPGENGALQVAYPAYLDALVWVARHTHGPVKVALIALPYTLDYWRQFRAHAAPARVTLLIGSPDNIPPADFVIWPMHLVQRHFPIPLGWRHHIAATITGGSTTYCYILT
ncbi:MAG: glycosyltransferase family 39 protein [Ktedonobacterales bacterium]|nr:glycosyltransferase family 39 protein [Ktedonobacterales bacterium]